MKREMSLPQSFSEMRGLDIRWLEGAEAERISRPKMDVFERVVWGLVWFLAILVVGTAVTGGTAIIKGLSQF